MAVSQSKAEAVQSLRDSARQAAEAGRDAANDAARTARSIASETAETSQRVARAGVDAAREGADTVQRTVESGMSMVAQMVEHSRDQFSRMWGLTGEQAEEAARRSSQNMQAIADCSQVLSQEFQDISREWIELAQNRLSKNLGSFDAFLRCRSPQELAAVQSDFMRENIELLLTSTRRIAELSVRMAEKAARPIKVQSGENTARVRPAA
jgi:hypothetical protein